MNRNHLTICIIMLCCAVFSCKKSDVPSPASALPPTRPPDTAARITSVLYPVTTPVGNAVEGYYVGLPSNYNQTTTRYPVLIYIPGAGQFGNGSIDLPLLLKDGPAELIDEHRFPGTFTVDGQTFSFIVFTPQLKWWPDTYSIAACIDFVKTKYRVDSTRIYLSGLSMGGILSCDLGSEIPNRIAAIVPMAGVSQDYWYSDRCMRIAQAGLPVWEFHSQDDPQIPIASATGFVDRVNSYHPAIPAKITIWANGGHDAWTRALEPSYKENGMNIYEWMLKYHR